MDDLISTLRREKLSKWPLRNLFYFAKTGNLTSLLEHGILSKNEVERQRLKSTSFAEETVQTKRGLRNIQLDNGRWMPLHDLVPLYLTPKTPALSSRRSIRDELVFVVVSLDVLLNPTIDIAFTDGNAASTTTTYHWSLNRLSKIPWNVIQSEYWNDIPDGKRKRCSEFLVHPKVAPSYITRLVVATNHTLNSCRSLIQKTGQIEPPIEIVPGWFF